MSAISLPVERARGAWLFSRGVDLGVFGGSAAAALLLLAVGARLGVLHGDTPEWTWVPAVLLVDVAHVWSTAFRVYLDPAELKRRAALYALVPLVGYVSGVVLYQAGDLVFWRVLAYIAVFHFVRQQWGWVALYRAKAGEREGALVDGAAVYAATLFPLVWWHANTPRAFSWFVRGDFVAGLPHWAGTVAAVPYAIAMSAWLARSGWGWIAHRRGNAGKDLVIATTAMCWLAGIVLLDSDYAFTVTNVLIHGVPYFALVWLYVKRRALDGEPIARRVAALGPLAMLGTVWIAAYVEELLWDRGVWHERGWLFGGAWRLGRDVRSVVVPLLALPQLVHYVLDGFVWRRAKNPDVARVIGEGS